MKKCYKNALVTSAIAAAALMMASQAFAAHTDPIVLKDADGAALAPGSTAAYSAKQTCGTCHDYNAIERHSYHAQLGANQHFGFNPYKNGTWNAEAANGKPWVSSPGHVGKW
ncbi:MAG: cytochrome C [Deltaproteobacteria bacterium]|nr:cytochrome C [Deltaproteobacteria bacterium]